MLSASELKDFYKHDEDTYHGHAIATHFGSEEKATAHLDLNKDGANTSRVAATTLAKDDVVLSQV